MLFCLHPLLFFFPYHYFKPWFLLLFSWLTHANICLCNFLKIPCVFELHFFLNCYCIGWFQLCAFLPYLASLFLPTTKLILIFFGIFFAGFIPLGTMCPFNHSDQQKTSMFRSHLLLCPDADISFVLCLQSVPQNIFGHHCTFFFQSLSRGVVRTHLRKRMF